MVAKVRNAETTAEEFKAEVGKGFEQTLAAVKDGIEQATKGLESSQAQIKENVEKAMKTAEDFVSFGQGNVEAVVKSSQVWATGVQDLSKTFATTAQASVEESVAALKALATAKSLKEAVDLQVGLARTTIEKAMAESGRLTDASFKLFELSWAPIGERVSLAVEKFAKAF
ncbi:MAG: phasin family protein [Acetobacteraceae bacterium]